MADEPFWPGEKYSSASSTSVRCRWRISIARRSIDEAMTPSVAKNIAWRSRGMTCVETGSARQAELVRDMLLDARIDVGEGADGAGDGAGGDLGARGDEALAAARELGIGLRQLEAEGGRLGVDAVAAADRDGVLVLEGAALQRGQQRVDVGEQDVGGARQLDAEAGVEHVGRGHALVDEARVGADELGEMGQEGDDVVLGLALDLVDARRRRTSRRCPFPRSCCAASFGMTPSSARASQAWASISNQMRNRVSGDQMATISGRE